MRSAFSKLFGRRADPDPTPTPEVSEAPSPPVKPVPPLELSEQSVVAKPASNGGQTPAQALARRLATAATQPEEQPKVRPVMPARHDPLKAAKASATEISQAAAKAAKPAVKTPAPEVAPVAEQPVAAAVKASADLSPLQELDGFLGAALADAGSHAILSVLKGRTDLDPSKAALAFGDVVRAKLSALKALNLDDTIEDIVSVLGTQYHMIRPLAAQPELYLYLALDRESGNLALARTRLKVVEANTRIG